MSCISIQKKPTLWGELLMVFINNSYEYESYHSKAPMVRLFLQRYKIFLIKAKFFKCYFYKLIDKNKLYVYVSC
jgi:hypothetical protein